MQCGNRRRLGTGAWLGVAWCALSLVLGLTVGSAHAQGADDAASVDYAAGRLSAQESAVDLSVALRPGESAVQLASTGTADLSVLSDGDRDCLAAGKNTELAATVQGPGWLVFDWKFSAQGAYTNKLNLTVDGVENPNAAPNRSYDWFTDSSVVPLGANSSSSVKWATMVVQLDGEGPHTVKWTRAGTALNACLDDVHFTSSPNTAVSGIAGAGTASCALTVLDEDHRTVDAGSPLGADGVRPYGVVAFSAVPEQGKTFRGWKADPAAEEFVSTANPYIVRVYSDPVSLYAVCEQPFEGAGTPDDPYRIGARADLERLDAYVSAGESFADAHFAITSDIDCGDQPLSTIGAGASKSFSGQVDGRGHTIAFSGAGALFYAMAGAGVRNLCLDVDVNAADAVNAGALADRSTNGSSVADVVLRGRFFASRPASSWGTNFGYGGLVGSASGTTFSDCRIEADCSSDRQGNADPCLGAVVGYATSNCTIERCVVAGNVDGCGAASAVGGIVGGLTANSSCVTDCVVQGDVSGNARVGGIVGYQTGGTVSNCEYRGAVSAARRAGGIVGGLEGTGQVSSCLASGSISASEEQAGGIVGYASGYASLADNLCLAQAVEGGKRIVASCERSWGNGAWNTPVLQGNYAWAGTLVDGSAVATGDADASAGGLNGAVLEDADLLGSVAYEPCVRWPSASWNVQPGRKPQLAASNAVREQSGDLLPGYIRAYAEFPEFALAWTGAEVSIEAPADAGYALSGTTRGTDPGEYIARATLAEGYIWPDYTTAPIDFAWSITRTVAVPQFGPFAFAGSPVSVQAPAGAGYALSGQTTAAAVGSYEAVAMLEPHCVWEDGTRDAKTVAWQVAAADIGEAHIDAIADAPYTGEPIEPQVVLRVGAGAVDGGGDVLVEGRDYAVSYADNVFPGRATATVQAAGDYTGSQSVSFQILSSDAYLADKQAADDVAAAVRDIGTVGIDSRDAIDAALAAIEGLTDVQRQLVPAEVWEELASAEAAYDQAVAEREAAEWAPALPAEAADALLKPGGQLAVFGQGQWSAAAEDGRSFVQSGADDAVLHVSVPKGGGWLLFDWMIEAGSTAEIGTAIDFSVSTVVATSAGGPVAVDVYPWGGLSASASGSARWATAAIVVPADACMATFAWSGTAAGQARARIGNVRFVTERTQVSAQGDAHATATVQAPYGENAAYVPVDQVDPGQGLQPSSWRPLHGKVRWSAQCDEGYVFAGWKLDAADDAYYSTEAELALDVLDEPVHLYAASMRPFDAGSGSADNPFVIEDAQDLAALDAHVRRGVSFEGMHLKLAADIAVPEGFAGIGADGAYGSAFAGTLDGAGHTVSGLGGNCGLFFAIARTGTVRDLHVAGAVEAGKAGASLGLVACTCNGLLENVHASGTVASEWAGDAQSGIGGVVGRLGSGGRMAGCSSDATVSATAQGQTEPAAGGIAGRAADSASVRDCASAGTVSGAATASAIGGVVGALENAASVQRCHSSGQVEGNMRVGGVVGAMGNGCSVSDCEHAGDVVAHGVFAGGIVGRIDAQHNAPAEVRDCLFAAGSVRADGDLGCAGGIVGSAAGGYAVAGSLSLAQAVQAPSAAGRIAGQAADLAEAGGAGVLSANCSWADTSVNGETVPTGGEHDDAAGAQGRGIAGYDLLVGDEPVSACAGWDATTWDVAAHAKPTLIPFASRSGANLPAYLFFALGAEDVRLARADYYLGLGQTAPELSVSARGAELQQGRDYTVSYESVDGVQAEAPLAVAGNYYALVTGTGAYGGTVKVPFQLLPALQDCSIRAIADRTYTGSAIRPRVTVTYRDVDGAVHELLKDEDYTFDYRANTDAGTGVVVVTGGECFPGTIERTFVIAKAPNTLALSAKKDVLAATYNAGGAQVLAIGDALAATGAQGAVSYAKASGDAGIAVSAAGAITLKKGLAAGTYPVRVVVTAAGDANHEPTSVGASFSVQVVKAANTFIAKGKTAKLKFAQLKKTKRTLKAKKVAVVKKAKGALAYKKLSGNKKIKVAKNGKVTVKKGLGKGRYIVKLRISAVGTANYLPAAKTVKFKLRVI